MKAEFDSRVKVCLVGTGAVRANPNRGGPCQIVEIGGEAILVDCGRGAVASISRLGYTVANINTVCVTHLHFDHICDLAHFVLLAWNNGRRERIRFFGPPGLEDYLRKGVREAFERDIESRLGHGKDPLGIEWSVREISTDGCFHTGRGYEMHALSTPHAGLENLNYRVDASGKCLGITSDTSPADTLASFYEGADLLVAECSGTREFLHAQPWGHWHLWPEALGRIATKAGVSQLVLKHLVIEDWSDDPDVSEKMAATVREHFAGRVDVGYDGLTVSI